MALSRRRGEGTSTPRGSAIVDTPITLALFAAFLLGMVAGSGLVVLVRARRY